MTSRAELLRSRLRPVPDFPRPGVLFQDIGPLLRDPVAYAEAVDGLTGCLRELAGAGGLDCVLAVEARGFLLGAAPAFNLKCGVVPLRKVGRLPGATAEVAYDLEYGSAALQLQRDVLRPGDRVVVVDDVLATGGTAAAAVELAVQAGAQVLGVAVLLELSFLSGRSRLAGSPVRSLLTL